MERREQDVERRERDVAENGMSHINATESPRLHHLIMVLLLVRSSKRSGAPRGEELAERETGKASSAQRKTTF